MALEVSVRVAGFGQWCLKDASQCKMTLVVAGSWYNITERY